MSRLWLVSLAVLVAGAVPALLVLRRLVEQARGLRADVGELRRLRPAVVEVRDDFQLLRTRLRQTRRR